MLSPFAGPGEMSRRLREFDWSRLPWGPVESWPSSLQTALGICLSSPVPAYIGWGPDLNLIYNDACIPLLGDRHPAALGSDARVAWPEIWADVVLPPETGYLHAQPEHGAQAARGDGRKHSLTPIYDGPRPAGLFGLCTVASPVRSLASEEIAQANAKFRAMFDQGTHFAVLLSEQGQVLEINRFALEAGGFHREQMIGKAFWDCPWWTHSEALQGHIRKACRSVALGETFRGQTSYLAADGSERMWDFTISPVTDEEGSVLFIGATGMDTTERTRTEAALFDSRSETEIQRRIYEAILSNTPDLAYVFDLDHRFIYANAGLLKMWGRTEEEALGKTCWELGYEPWHAAMHDREIDQVAATGQPLRGEVPFTGTFGRRIYDYIFVPVFNARGEVAFVAGTTRDVTDRQNDEQQLRSYAEELSQSNRRKTEFLAMLAHELRNPLAPIRNALELLQRADTVPALRAEALHMVDRQLKQLVRLVDDLLDISRISRGIIELRRQETDLHAILRQAAETAQPMIDRAGQRLRLELADGNPMLQADPVRLAQVISNLLNNASRYSPSGAEILLSARQDGEALRVSVRDEGIGIDPAMREKIFEMFVQADRTERAAQGGLGIGLALVRSLVELHGGRVVAHSDGPGCGSEFVLHLPAGPETAPVAGEAETADARSGLDGCRVLVVDDNQDAADSMAMLLQLNGAEVSIAHDGPGALEQALSLRPDVIVLDIGLPGMTGHEVCRELRSRTEISGPIVVALTGWGTEQDQRESMAAGFDAHLTKPVDFGVLMQRLQTLRSTGARAP